MSRDQRLALAFVAAATLLRLVAAALLPLSADEAYYWLWAKAPALGYVDHPPMVAWLIAASTAIFGEAAWAVRLPAWLGFGALHGLAVYLAARRYDWKIARNAAALLACVPFVHLGGVIVTPDAPLLIFWVLFLFFAMRAMADSRPADFVAAGLALGLGLLSKFTMWLAVPAFLLVLLVRGTKKQRALGLLSLGAALLVALPHFVWCAQNDWLPFVFQSAHLADTRTGGVPSFFGFVGAQIGLLSPIVALLVFMLLKRRHSLGDEARLLLPFIWLPLLAGLVLAAFTHAEAGWAAVAYPAALWLIAVNTRPGGLLSPRVFNAALVVALVFVVLLYAWAFGLAGPISPTMKSRELVRVANTIVSRLPASRQGLPLVAQNYRLASLAGYYLMPARRPVAVLPVGNQPISQLERQTPHPDLSRGFLWLAQKDVSGPPNVPKLATFDCVTSNERWPELRGEPYLLMVCVPGDDPNGPPLP